MSDRENAPSEEQSSAAHTRKLSFQVKYSPAEVAQLSQEVYDETIADVHMSLFVYWMSEQSANFEQARRHIRELGLDQSYPTSRISNPTLRKLLDDTIGLRPAYAYPKPEEDDPFISDSKLRYAQQRYPPRSSNRWKSPERSSSLDVLTPSHSADDTGLEEVLRAHAKAQKSRAPLFQTPPAHMANNGTPHRQTSSSWPKSSSTPVQARDRAGTDITSPIRAFPPNTPDRPLPLNVRSRGSDGTTPSSGGPAPLNIRPHGYGEMTPVLRTTVPFPRSVSTPIRSHPGSPRTATQPERHSSLQANSTTILAKPTQTGGMEVETRTSIMPEDARRLSQEQPDTSSEPQASVIAAEVKDRGEIEAADAYQSPSIDDMLARVTIEELIDSFPSPPRNQERHHSDPQVGRFSSGSHTTSSDASPSPEKPQFALVATPSRREAFVARAVPTLAERRQATLVRRAMNPPAVGSVSRPLPLRRYDSEAALGTSTHAHTLHRVPSAGSAAGHSLPRAGMKEMALRIGHANPVFRSSTSSRLTARGGASRMASNRTSGDEETTDALAAACRAINSACLIHLIEQTRARGALLPTVNLASLSPFEIAWRDANEKVVVGIYGRKDVVISHADLELVERVARNLRECASGLAGEAWVQFLFGESEN